MSGSRLAWSSSLLLVLSLACGPGKDGPSADESSTDSETTGVASTETETESGEEPAECEDERCNPLDPTDCAEGEMCIFFNTEFICATYSGDGSGVAGAPCETPTDCEPGLACIQSVFFSDCASGACCSPNCAVADPEVCNPGEICNPWTLGDDTDPCYVDVGVCIVEA